VILEEKHTRSRRIPLVSKVLGPQEVFPQAQPAKGSFDNSECFLGRQTPSAETALKTYPRFSLCNKLVDKLVCSTYNKYMKSVGAFEAKTHLNELLRRAFEGETIQITRRGIPMAKLTPPDNGIGKDLRKIAGELRQLRKGALLKKTSIRELIDEGRRY
jgi:prevent-host-death family protein